MTEDNKILSLNEKIQLLARDIYDTAIIKNSLELEHFAPSKQVQNLLDEDEFISLIAYLRKNGVLAFTYREPSIGTVNRHARKNSFITYKIVINQPNIRLLLGLKASKRKPVEGGIKLLHEYSILLIGTEEIPLGKGKLHKSLQYWICRLCLEKPNSPVQETDIMEQYAENYEINARSRAVRDAVYKLNPKIKSKTGIDQLFTYSNGYVVFNANKLK